MATPAKPPPMTAYRAGQGWEGEAVAALATARAAGRAVSPPGGAVGSRQVMHPAARIGSPIDFTTRIKHKPAGAYVNRRKDLAPLTPRSLMI